MILDIISDFICKKKSKEVHSIEPEIKSKCISNITVHINI